MRRRGTTATTTRAPLARARRSARVLAGAARMQVSQVTAAGSTLVIGVVQPTVFLVVALSAMDAPTGPEALRVVVGAALTSLWGATIWSAGGILRRELWWGTFGASVTGVHRPELVLLGKSLGATILSAGMILASVSLVATLLGHPPVPARPGWALLGLAGALLSATALAMWMASAFLLTRAAVRLSEALMYPVFILGGMLVPLELLPAGVRWLSVGVSFRWAQSLIEGAVAGGAVAAGDVAWLALLTVAYAVGAVLTFGRVLDRARRRGTLEIV